MSDGDDFLLRWSRRKRAVAEAERAALRRTPEADAPSDQSMDAAPVARAYRTLAPAAQEPEFDVASLPPIESICADTDITAFLKPSVPQALRHAALRRAWAADPVIRSFKGLAENDWDFTSPDTPGFGPLDPGFDVKAMLEQLFGEAKPTQIEPATEVGAVAEDQTAQVTGEMDGARLPASGNEPALADSQLSGKGVTQGDLPQCGDDIALQQAHANYSSLRPGVRRHGSALPRVLPD